MAGFPYYYIDIVGSPDNFQIVLKAPNGQIVHTLENSKQIAKKIEDSAYTFVYRYYGSLTSKLSLFEDGNTLVYSFYRVVYPILLEQYISSLYESKGIRIQYPNINVYLTTLYKFYKILANPKSTLNIQEFAMLVNPLIGRVHWNNSSFDLITLFVAFVDTYYKVMNYKKKVRIGLNPFSGFYFYFK